jgi:MATE family multidrug resistance protein
MDTDENWNRRVLRLAGPIILSNVSVPLVGLVDTAVVGHLPGAENIGAVAIGAVTLGFFYWGFGFLRMSTTGFTAQALGADDRDEARAVLARAALLAISLGLLAALLKGAVAWLAIRVIAPDSAVAELARSYIAVRLLGAPAGLFNIACIGWFVGVRDTRPALIAQVGLNLINMALAIWFVIGLGWGVKGVAAAGVIAEYGAAALWVFFARGRLAQVGGIWRWDLVRRLDRLTLLFAANRDIFLRSLCLQMAFMTFTAVGARMDEVTLAANAVLTNMQSILAYGLDAFANVTEAMAGNAVGARDRARFRTAIRVTSRWALGLAVVYALGYWLAGPSLIGLLTNQPEVREATIRYLPWMVFSPFISVCTFQIDGIFIGATRGADMRNGMVISVAIYVGALLLLVPPLGNHGLWLSLMILLTARFVTLAMRYPRLERSVGQPGPL